MSRSRRRHKSSFKKKPVISYNVSKEITKDKSPETKRNSHGDIIYCKKYVGDEKFEYWIEYNDNHCPIYYHNTRGYEWRCRYNNKGNISDYWDNTGYEEQYKYYINNIIICTTSFGEKIKKVINRSERLITRDIFINS